MGSIQDRTQRRADGRSRLPTGFATLRDIITFVVGMAFMCNEIFLQEQVEATALAIGAAMTGLPLVFSADERRKSSQSNPQSAPPPETPLDPPAG